VKLLTATSSTQGYRDNDFDFCVEGELVHINSLCAADHSDPDGPCGCGRSFTGLNSHAATTTVLIRDLPGFTPADYVAALRSSLEQQGRDAAHVIHEAAALYTLARQWPNGTVLERRLDQVAARGPIRQPG
jgi:hypothetical protein